MPLERDLSHFSISSLQTTSKTRQTTMVNGLAKGFMKQADRKRVAVQPVRELQTPPPPAKKNKQREAGEAIPPEETSVPEGQQAPDSFEDAIKTVSSGDQYVKHATLVKMPWDKKKKICNRQWSVRINLSHNLDAQSYEVNTSKYEASLAYLLTRLEHWATPAFVYVGPVYQRNNCTYFQVDIALQFDSLCTYSSICKHLGAWREDKPMEYHVWPSPGTPFQGLLGPYGLLDPGRTLVKTGPLFVRGTPRETISVWKSVLQLDL